MLNFLKQGNGKPTVVFIHGFCESLHVWDDFTETLSQYATFTSMAIDLPGFGESPLLEGETTIAGYAEAVHKTIAAADIERPIIIGHSLGGYVALAYAEAYPDNLGGLCLFHSTAYADSEEKKANRDKVAQFVAENGSHSFVPTLVQGLFAAGFAEKSSEILELLIEDGRRGPAEGIVAATLAMRNRPDRTDTLRALQVPCLMIAGKEDQATPMQGALEQSALPNDSQLHVLGGVAHMGMFEAKAQTARTLANFVKYCAL